VPQCPAIRTHLIFQKALRHITVFHHLNIKNKKCYVGEIKNDTIISCNSIKQISGEHEKCYLYFNNYNGKIYFVLTKKDGANYLFENISKNFSSGENLKASIGLNISTYEVEE